MPAETTISVSVARRDQFKDYVRYRSSQEGRDYTYDDLLGEWLDSIGWGGGRRGKP